MIKPLQDYFLLKEIKKKQSIIIEVKEEESNEAEVIDFSSSKLGLKKRDKVLIKRYGFEEIEYDKEKYLIGKEENIIAKL